MQKQFTAKTQKQLVTENEELRSRLDEAERTLHAIRSGETDALIVSGAGGGKIFTWHGADRSYSTLIEEMDEGALSVTMDGVTLKANHRFAEMVKTPLEKIMGSAIPAWVAVDGLSILQALLRKGG